jgi:hypothetical protein
MDTPQQEAASMPDDGAMTQEEARALLRNPDRPTLPAVGLTGAERDWIAAQPWRETPRGWLVDGLRDGTRYHVDREPGADLADGFRSLYVVAGNKATGVWLSDWRA